MVATTFSDSVEVISAGVVLSDSVTAGLALVVEGPVGSVPTLTTTSGLEPPGGTIDVGL